MSAKLLDTFCTYDIRNCYHQHSRLSLGPFFLSYQTYTQFRSHFSFSAEAASGRPCELKPQSASPRTTMLVIETMCGAEIRQPRPLLSGGTKDTYS